MKKPVKVLVVSATPVDNLDSEQLEELGVDCGQFETGAAKAELKSVGDFLDTGW